ncbi:hypothetical protein [Desulforhopalus sp. 52FAK]
MTAKQLKGGEYLIVNMPSESVFTPEDFSDEQKQFGETTELFAKNEKKIKKILRKLIVRTLI